MTYFIVEIKKMQYLIRRCHPSLSVRSFLVAAYQGELCPDRKLSIPVEKGGGRVVGWTKRSWQEYSYCVSWRDWKSVRGKGLFGGHPIESPSAGSRSYFQDNCLFVAGRRGHSPSRSGRRRATRKQKTADWIIRLDLAEKARLSPRRFSGGSEPRLRSHVPSLPRPRFLLLDEPFRALDHYYKEGLQDLLIQFADEPIDDHSRFP